MATNKNPIFLNTLETNNVSIADTDTTTQKTVMTAGTDGAAITRMSATSIDASAKIIVLKLTDGTTEVTLGEVSVPAGAGTDGSTPAKSLLDAGAMPGVLQADGSLVLGASAVLKVNAKVTLTAGDSIGIMCQGGQYAA